MAFYDPFVLVIDGLEGAHGRSKRHLEYTLYKVFGNSHLQTGAGLSLLEQYIEKTDELYEVFKNKALTQSEGETQHAYLNRRMEDDFESRI